MLPRKTTKTLVTADDDGVAKNQTPGAAGNLTLNGDLVSGGVGVFDTARRVLLTTASDESGKTVTIYGTDGDGNEINETLTGPNATTGYTSRDFKTVTRVAVSAAFTGNIKVGSNGVGSTRWINLDHRKSTFQVGVLVNVTGSVVYNVEKTYDDLAGKYSPSAHAVWVAPGIPLPVIDPILNGVSADGETILTGPVNAVRATILSGTGSIELTVIQAG